MKNWKNLLLLLALFAFSVTATSCSDDDPVNTEQNDKPDQPDQPDQPDNPDQPDKPDQPDQPVESKLPKLGEVYSLVEFMGVDENDTSIGYLAIYVSSQTLGVDDNENFIGTGAYIGTLINIEVPASGTLESIPAGTYPVNKTQSAVVGTVASSIYYAVENSKELVSEDMFADGSLTIQSLGNEQYKLVYDFTTKGGYTVKDECTTTLTINAGDDEDISTLTGDVTVGTLASAVAGYSGPNAQPSVSDYYTVVLTDGTPNMAGENLILSFNVTPGAKGGVPAGTYPIIDPYYTEGFSFSTVKPFTATAGFSPSETDIDGCWYFNFSDETNPAQARLCSGDIEVSTDGTNYTFAGKLYDYYGHAVTFSYTGAAQYVDLTQQQTSSLHPLKKTATKRSLRSRAANRFPACFRF